MKQTKLFKSKRINKGSMKSNFGANDALKFAFAATGLAIGAKILKDI